MNIQNLNTVTFYQALSERWKQIFNPRRSETNEKVPHLTDLAQKVLLNNPLSCQSLPSRPCSLIKKILPNKFTIFVQERQNPLMETPVASMYLVVKTGHLYEEDHERGLAHLVEHGLFQGTENFTRNEIEELFKSLGCRPGADSNAQTDFDSTIYQLNNIPTKDLTNWNRAIELFFDFCTTAIFPESYMIKEREVVLDELLRKKGHLAELRLHQYSMHSSNSRYITRYPNQLSESIKSASEVELRELLLEFYKKWYRPDNMALIIVGDFGDSLTETINRNQLINLLEEKFGQIPHSSHSFTPTIDSDPLLDEELRVIAPWQPGLRTSAFTHSNFQAESCILSRRQKFVELDDSIENKKNIENIENIISEFVDRIFEDFLSSTLNRIKKLENSPLLSWSWSANPYSFEYSDSSLYQSGIVALHGRAQEAVNLFIRVIKRLELNGFYEDHLEAYLDNEQSLMLKAIIKEPSISFQRIIQDYASSFVKELAPNTQLDEVFKLFLFKQMKKEDLNHPIQQLAKQMTDFQQQETSLLLLSTDTSQKAEAKASELRELLLNNSHEKMVIEQFTPNFDTSWLRNLHHALTPVVPITTQCLSSIQAHQWCFENQIKVLYKPMPNVESNIYLEFSVPRGLLHLSSRHDVLHRVFGFLVLNKIGLADKTYSELEFVQLKTMVDSVAAMATNDLWKLSFTIQNIEGLESALQILHLRLTDTRPFESEEFARCWKTTLAQTRESFKKKLETEGGILSYVQSCLECEDHPLLKLILPEEIETLSLDKARESLIECFQQISQGSLLICGSNAKSEDIQALVERYIGSLRPSPIKQNSSVTPLFFTPGQHKTLHEGRVPDRAKAFFYIPIKNIQDPKLLLQLTIAERIVQVYLNDKVRKEEQLVYGLGFNVSMKSDLFELGFATLSLQCATNKISTLVSEVWQIMDSIVNLSDTELNMLLDKQKIGWRRDLANQKNNTLQWFKSLSSYLKRNFDPSLICQREEWLESMTVEDLKSMLRVLLSRKNEFKSLILHPKKSSDLA